MYRNDSWKTRGIMYSRAVWGPPYTDMKIKVAIGVHCEETFRYCMDETFIADAVSICKEAKYLFHMTSMIEDMEPIPEIAYFGPGIIEWGWGYEVDVFYDSPEEEQWVIESGGHEYTWVPEELRPDGMLSWLKLDSVDLVVFGGHRYECLRDFECVLDHLEIPYTLGDAIYG